MYNHGIKECDLNPFKVTQRSKMHAFVEKSAFCMPSRRPPAFSIWKLWEVRWRMSEWACKRSRASSNNKQIKRPPFGLICSSNQLRHIGKKGVKRDAYRNATDQTKGVRKLADFRTRKVCSIGINCLPARENAVFHAEGDIAWIMPSTLPDGYRFSWKNTFLQHFHRTRDLWKIPSLESLNVIRANYSFYSCVSTLVFCFQDSL